MVWCLYVCVRLCLVSFGAVAAGDVPQQGSCPPCALPRSGTGRCARPHAKSRLFSGWRPCDGASTCGGAQGLRGTGAQGRAG